MSKIALLAGKGELPVEFLKALNGKVVTFALEGITDKGIEEYSLKTVWIKPFKFRKFFKSLKEEKVDKIVLLGKIEHALAFSPMSLDIDGIRFLLSLKDKKPQTIIKTFIKELEKRGVEVVDPKPYLSHLFAEPGVLSGKVSEEFERDAKFGMKVAKTIAELDIGQTVVVKDETVIAVEGVEGTDQCIKRGANLCGKGFVVCKAGRVKQDMRIDVPTVGPDTLQLIGNLGGRGLVFEARKTYILSKAKFLEEAKRWKLTVLAI